MNVQSISGADAIPAGFTVNPPSYSEPAYYYREIETRSRDTGSVETRGQYVDTYA
jgi:hypothetical protein